MPVITPEAKTAPHPQNISQVCTTHRRRTDRLAALYLLIMAFGVAAAVWAYHYFSPLCSPTRILTLPQSPAHPGG